ncbi:hypothetical protein Dimus_008646, partial [Dionaea muscipula]
MMVLTTRVRRRARVRHLKDTPPSVCFVLERCETSGGEWGVLWRRKQRGEWGVADLSVFGEGNER